MSIEQGEHISLERRARRPVAAPILVAASALIGGVSGCYKSSRETHNLDTFRSTSTVTMNCPATAPAGGPILIGVTMDADARTYWDNQGVIDQALQVLLVRSDRPGVLYLAKTDPAASLLPVEPLPGRPSNEELAKGDKGRVSEHKEYDLRAYGRGHAGGAQYHVLASFADAWAGPTALRVVDATPLPPELDEAALPVADQGDHAIPPSQGLALRLVERRGRPAVVGAFRRPSVRTATEAAFVSIVMARRRALGGTSYGQFRVASTRLAESDQLGTFAVPLSALAPTPEPGRYVLFAFVGELAASALTVDVR